LKCTVLKAGSFNQQYPMHLPT